MLGRLELPALDHQRVVGDREARTGCDLDEGADANDGRAGEEDAGSPEALPAARQRGDGQRGGGLGGHLDRQQRGYRREDRERGAAGDGVVADELLVSCGLRRARRARDAREHEHGAEHARRPARRYRLVAPPCRWIDTVRGESQVIVLPETGKIHVNECGSDVDGRRLLIREMSTDLVEDLIQLGSPALEIEFREFLFIEKSSFDFGTTKRSADCLSVDRKNGCNPSPPGQNEARRG